MRFLNEKGIWKSRGFSRDSRRFVGDWKLLVALALLGVLLLNFGCAQAGTQEIEGEGIEGEGAAKASSNLSAEDIGSLDNPDSESLDLGIPLEDI